MTVYYTHINRQKIDANRKYGKLDPVITIKRGKSGKPTYAHEVRWCGDVTLVYSETGEPVLPCGARAVMVSEEPPIIVR